MKHKGFTIEPVYMVGSDFRILNDGRVVDRKPTSKDIEYYQIVDEDGDEWIRESTIAECKETIDSFLIKCKAIDDKFNQ